MIRSPWTVARYTEVMIGKPFAVSGTVTVVKDGGKIVRVSN